MSLKDRIAKRTQEYNISAAEKFSNYMVKHFGFSASEIKGTTHEEDNYIFYYNNDHVSVVKKCDLCSTVMNGHGSIASIDDLLMARWNCTACYRNSKYLWRGYKT